MPRTRSASTSLLMRMLMRFSSLVCCSYCVYRQAGTSDLSFWMAYSGRGTGKKPVRPSGSACVLHGLG